MQVFLTRSEIRRRLRASLGQTTDEGLGTMNRAKLDQSIEQAALQAHTDMRPVRAQKETTFDLGTQQSEVEYPEDASPDSLIEAAVFHPTEKRYCPLRRKRRGPARSDDQALIAGGDDMKAESGFPRWISSGPNAWQVYPTTDQPYALRVLYLQRQGFVEDDDVSTVDAQLILSKALELETRTYDKDASQQHQQDYELRKAKLKGFEQTGARIAYDEDATFDDHTAGADFPNYDTRPARQPEA